MKKNTLLVTILIATHIGFLPSPAICGPIADGGSPEPIEEKITIKPNLTGIAHVSLGEITQGPPVSIALENKHKGVYTFNPSQGVAVGKTIKLFVKSKPGKLSLQSSLNNGNTWHTFKQKIHQKALLTIKPNGILHISQNTQKNSPEEQDDIIFDLTQAT